MFTIETKLKLFQVNYFSDRGKRKLVFVARSEKDVTRAIEGNLILTESGFSLAKIIQLEDDFRVFGRMKIIQPGGTSIKEIIANKAVSFMELREELTNAG